MKKLTRFRLIPACIILLAVLSCRPIYYVPVKQEIPLFTEKNQGRLNFGLSAFGETGGFNLSGAYSITNNLGVIGNVVAVGGESESSIDKGFLAGLGAVYYHPFNENLVFETTLGYAFGNSINGNFYGLDIQNKVNFNNFYIQPSIGMVKKHVEIALSAKYNIHSFTNLSSEFLSYYEQGLVISNSYWTGYGDLINYTNPLNKLYHFIEPAVTVRFGWQSVKFDFQYVNSLLLSATEISRKKSNISIGMQFKLGGKK